MVLNGLNSLNIRVIFCLYQFDEGVFFFFETKTAII